MSANLKANYIRRWILKYKQSRDMHTKRGSFFITLRYSASDIVSLILTMLFASSSSKFALTPKSKVLFIEPSKQGFGDLYFQKNALDYIANKANLTCILNGGHSAILEGSKVHYVEDPKCLESNYDIVIYLSRSSIKENLLARSLCRKSGRVSMDKDMRIWRTAFMRPHSEAWSYVFNRKFNLRIEPKRIAKLDIESEHRTRTVFFLALTPKMGRNYISITQINDVLAMLLNFTDLSIRLDGVYNGPQNVKDISRHNRVENFINQTTYRNAILKISSSELFVGPEGSLAHIAVSYGIPSIILSYGRDGEKYNANYCDNNLVMQVHDPNDLLSRTPEVKNFINRNVVVEL